jgi:hypothetical protein
MSGHRISLSTIISGDDRGLKTFIQQFLAKLNIAGEVERVLGSDRYSTSVVMEGLESNVQTAKLLLIESLKQAYPNLPTPVEWKPKVSMSDMSSESRSKFQIKPTTDFATCREVSFGENSNADVFEVAPGDSASVVSFSLGARSLSLLGHIAHIMKKIDKNVVTVSYACVGGNRHELFDTTTCTSLSAFLEMVDISKELAIPIHARKLYARLHDGSRAYVSQFSTLENGKEYWVETDLNKPNTLKKGILWSNCSEKH